VLTRWADLLGAESDRRQSVICIPLCVGTRIIWRPAAKIKLFRVLISWIYRDPAEISLNGELRWTFGG
jgi:hypothetical protein